MHTAPVAPGVSGQRMCQIADRTGQPDAPSAAPAAGYAPSARQPLTVGRAPVAGHVPSAAATAGHAGPPGKQRPDRTERASSRHPR